MSALVTYASSDEDEEGTQDEAVGSEDFKNDASSTGNEAPKLPSTETTNGGHDTLGKDNTRSEASGLNGTALGPVGPPEDQEFNGDTTSAPQSPYSANRAAIRNLTLPSTPNLDIPPSPPGSPPPGMDRKFEHFLELKKEGVHFNQKLAQSSALKNPSLLYKLMASAGLEEDDQYNTTLPEEIWNPKGFPPWAYKEELAKSQQEVTRKREEERSRLQRESIDFVSAANSGNSTRSGTPAATGGNKGSKASAAERIMAGLDRERMKPIQANPASSRKDTERKGSRFDQGRPRIDSRSPKRRKRSRSR